jgi:hypothetical protein
MSKSAGWRLIVSSALEAPVVVAGLYDVAEWDGPAVLPPPTALRFAGHVALN